MTSQTPTFRLTVADLMAGHHQRLAARIDKELRRQGKDTSDLAYALRITPRTAERWIAGEVEPQRRLQRPLADYLALPIEELFPDLAAEEKALHDQLARIEDKLDLLLEVAALSLSGPDAVLEAEADRLDALRERIDASLRRKRGKDSSS